MDSLHLMLDAAGDAAVALFTINRLMYLMLGVFAGLAIGLLPGIGGLTGFALLVPFTYNMDPIAAFAMLVGMSAVTSTSDTIPAVLFGVPGTASSQATVLDGFSMAKKGEAGRALAAGYIASLMGGLFGAVVLALSVPVIRPFVLAIGTPELLALTIFGIAMVASLSGTAPLRGIVAACFGILVGMVGSDQQTGTLRWSSDVLYFWDGIPMLPVLLGMFAIPELCDLAIKRRSVAERLKLNVWDGMTTGVRDTLQNWFLVLRCSSIGAICGMIPGITGAVTDWIAYGHALRTEKGASETFTKGDVRGVIAPESANNACVGGTLLPTLAFGVPGGASQAILLAAMMVHGFVPGPDMLTKHLDFTYAMVWSVAVANVVGAGTCFMLSGYFARLSTLRYTLVLPPIMAIVYIGAFQGSRAWGDLYALLFFGLLGWIMKRLRWPRPPVILGLVLGALIERYMGISIRLYGAEWMLRPVVMVFLALSAMALLRPLYSELRHEGLRALLPRGRFMVKPQYLLYVFFLGLIGYMVVQALGWPYGARIGPVSVGTAALVAGSISLVYALFSGTAHDAPVEQAAGTIGRCGIHMDLESDSGQITTWQVILRGAQFFGWFVAFLISMKLIGLLPTLPLLVVGFMRLEGRERWGLCFAVAAGTTLAIYAIFDQVIHIPWPPTVLGDLFPMLARYVPSM